MSTFTVINLIRRWIWYLIWDLVPLIYSDNSDKCEWDPARKHLCRRFFLACIASFIRLMTLNDQKSNSADSLNLKACHQGSADVHQNATLHGNTCRNSNTETCHAKSMFTHWQPYKTYTDLSIVLSIFICIYYSIILSFYFSVYRSFSRSIIIQTFKVFKISSKT